MVQLSDHETEALDLGATSAARSSRTLQKMAIASINPATGELLKTFEPLSDSQIEQRLQRAAAAFYKYRTVPFAERARMMTRAAEILESEKESLARTMTLEMGKPLRAAVEEA